MPLSSIIYTVCAFLVFSLTQTFLTEQDFDEGKEILQIRNFANAIENYKHSNNERLRRKIAVVIKKRSN